MAIKSAAEIESLASEFEDRFGKLPAAVKNLFYTVRIKTLAARAGIESIATEHGQIILRAFEGRHFDKRRLEPFLRYGVKIGLNQIQMDYRRLTDWRKVLEEVLKQVG